MMNTLRHTPPDFEVRLSDATVNFPEIEHKLVTVAVAFLTTIA